MDSFKNYTNVIFSRRSFILVALKCLFVFGLIIRLFFLQVLNSRAYRTLSEKNRIKFFLLEPKRGFIKDSKGVVLAENNVNYQLYFYKQLNKDYESSLNRVMNIFKLSQEDRAEIHRIVKSSNYLYPVLIRDNLSWGQVTKIESSGRELEGAYVNKGYVRYYPMKRVLAHVLGYVGIPSSDEIAEYQLYHASGFRIGKAGIEKLSNKDLIGEFGLKKVEVNAYREVIRDLGQESSVRGADVSITVNSELQQYTYDLLKEHGSSAIVLDIKTGDVISLVSRPAFDPNLFSSPITHQDWASISKNKFHPLTNRVISQLYPPGSTWKIVTALAVMRAGINPEKTVFCPGFTHVGNKMYKCWKEHGHGHVDLKGALRNSCNVYFYEMGIIAGIDNIHHIGNILGYGKKTGIQLQGEVSGINPSKEWKERVYSSKWLVGDTANSAIGQGYDLVTPIQLVNMIAAVASGRKLVPNLYLDSSKIADGHDIHIPQEHLQMIRNDLEEVFYHPSGSGYSIRIKEEEYRVAGKSGTAQVISGDTVSSGSKQVKSHSLFVGYAPIHDPRYAVSVVAENAGWGMQTAAPIGVKILYFAQTKI